MAPSPAKGLSAHTLQVLHARIFRISYRGESTLGIPPATDTTLLYKKHNTQHKRIL